MENLLTVTRLEDGGVTPQADCELVDDLVEEALRHVPADADHEVRFDAPAGAPAGPRGPVAHGAGDREPGGKRACAHSRGSHVCVSAARVAQMVEICVADDGPGIPDAEKDRVFEAFRTTGGALPDGTRSVGLGLAVCRAIARAHGGTIAVRDRAPRGCVFALSLPAEEVPRV